MPIKINLLAEERAAEEARRNDPLKRAIVIAACVVGVVLGLAIFNGFLVKGTTAELERIKAAYAEKEPAEKELIEKRRKTGKLEDNYNSLVRLATNRVMWAPVMHNLQLSMVDGVEVTEIRVSQGYKEFAKIVRPPESGVKSTPAKTEEHIDIEIKGYDAGDNYTQFINKIAQNEHFKSILRAREPVKLEQRDPPALIPGRNDGVEYRAFIIKCYFPVITRE